MKRTSSKAGVQAFTLIEVLVVIVVVAVLAAVLSPVFFGGGPRKDRPLEAVCINQLKQTGLSLYIWADDHGGLFPMQVPVTNGGSMEFIASGHASPHFQTLSNYLRAPQLLICPTDKDKTPITNFNAELSDRNVSYFINLDAVTNSPVSIIAGDRHLQLNGQPVKPGMFVLTSNLAIGWTGKLHFREGRPAGGSVAFADGHVQWSATDLTVLVRRQALATNRLAVP